MEHKVDKSEQANRILYDFGLLNELNKYGIPHIIGSYRMNLMAWNDLDIDVENESMSLEKLHQLTKYIVNKFNPIWYEAKQEMNEAGNRVWFHGFEFYLDNERWNVDIWFLDKNTKERLLALNCSNTFTILQKRIIMNLYKLKQSNSENMPVMIQQTFFIEISDLKN